MIIGAFIILLLLTGGAGSDFGDPELIASLEQDTPVYVLDPTRARNVIAAVEELKSASRARRGEAAIYFSQSAELARDYDTTLETALANNRDFRSTMMERSSQILDGREMIRANTTKKEWNALLKSYKKRGKEGKKN